MPQFAEGDHVVINNVIYCGECRPCLRRRYNFCRNSLFLGRHVDGGLAEYIKVPARNLSRLPANVSFAEGAIMGCGVVTAYHALKISYMSPGDCMVVWGTGGVGLSLIQLARELSPAYPIIAVGIQKHSLRLAGELGADFLVDASEEDPVDKILELTDGQGADKVFDAAGVKDVRPDGELATLASVCAGGALIGIATFGASVTVEPHDELGVFEKRFTGSCGNLPGELDFLVRLVAGRRRIDLQKLITDRINPEQVNDTIDAWRASTRPVIKAVVEF